MGVGTISQRIRGRIECLEQVGRRTFRDHGGRYLSAIQNVSSAFLELQRPEGYDPAAWQSYVVRWVSTLRLEVSGSRLRIYSSLRPAAQGEDGDANTAQDDASGVRISRDDLTAWVRAGRNGDPGGKRISDSEDPRPDDKIVDILEQALLNPDNEGLRRSIEQYLRDERTFTLALYLPELLVEWCAVLQPLVSFDVRREIRRCCKR